MEGWKSLGKSPMMRVLVFMVVAAMLLGALFVPITIALGEDAGTATPPPTTPGGTAPVAPDNPHAGVPGAPGGPPTEGQALSQALPGEMGAEVTHLVLARKDGSLSVFQMFQLVNHTQKDSGPLTILLPDGAANLKVVSGLSQEQVGQAEGGFVDRPGVPAGGSQQLALRYELPASGDAYTLRFKTSFPTALVYILTDPSAMTMPATLNTSFDDGGALDMGGRILRQYVRADLKAGDPVQVNLQFTPDQEALAQAPAGAQLPPAAGTGSGPAKANNTANIIVLAATGVLMLVALVLIWRRFSLRNVPAAAASSSSTPAAPFSGAAHVGADEAALLRRKGELVNEIARLDQRHAAGELDEAEHARRREVYKRELVSVLLQLKEIQG